MGGLKSARSSYPSAFKDLDVNAWRKSLTAAGEKISTPIQCGITCGAIDEPSRSSKAINKRVIINFCDKNVVIAHFCDKNDVFYFHDKMS